MSSGSSVLDLGCAPGGWQSLGPLRNGGSKEGQGAILGFRPSPPAKRSFPQGERVLHDSLGYVPWKQNSHDASSSEC
ncbi:hypothetical protein GLYMA_02G248600v4 [Glycine max]|uniref:Ribosomal RNA methyltransferase FtsJ domain-containing protein n=2 Tax=Glycine subgen. Soja TaxID=1462606 RepID=C6SV76_SOYBN|nr:uncharacterized protein LOC114398458 [Glycine soja]ACU13149.1 unknown [Glycine max]KAH1061962.1 hypothetical protein GYH30_005124 [Glycine max]KAH1263206.1 hypothetical protein GmHk_02G005663 [Glycine max]KRH73047.1 hypothetical protein GLYMA_02G248600v4 [Glycine max]RZC26627.1 hypothetical protein D0Y65_004998 [Glycine soja]